ncbi:MAG: hypothetical protein NWE92_11250 [Candidatus Bathyarchaeota archaeon]|nr:hypothetical protein [Candidatus Bathyarchaeota archaeon]
MHSRHSHLAVFALFLLLMGCFAASAVAQSPDPEQLVSVTLNSPTDTSTQTSFTVDFVYTPIIYGDDPYTATLFINGTATAAVNQTPIGNETQNHISYTFTQNGTCTWTIKVQNSTHSATPTAFTLTIQVPSPTPEPSPTPSPTPTATATATPQPTATATPKPTPTATPTPSPKPTDQPFALEVDGMMVLIIALVVVAVILAAVVVFLWNAAR